ncbi:MAG: agmatine deiminase family protein [Bdellovibrionota bacterium]
MDSSPTTNSTSSLQPAEWALHDACWLAWPWDGELWAENLLSAQKEFTDLCRAISANGGEPLHILVPDATFEKAAQLALAGVAVTFHRIPVGDIWLRDTAPIFVQENGNTKAHIFRFNGWGEKYLLDHDDLVSARVAEASRFSSKSFPFVLEGGSVDVDGEGTCLTTKQCLLNPNRNPSMNASDIETSLREALGATKILWLGDGLINDHTDGHIDTIARFVAPGVVVCMEATTEDDPNSKILATIRRDLESFSDARGRKLKVLTIPSPGRVENEEGDVMPASYVNFYIGNKSVVVPTYGVPADAKAVAAIAKIFPEHRTVGLSARAILSGGGAFHCITQQQPRSLA